MDQIDGIKEQVGKVEEYLKTLIVWVRIFMVSLIVISLIGIVVYNFFAPSDKDVSQQVINNLLTALNGAEFQAVLAPISNSNTTTNPTREV